MNAPYPFSLTPGGSRICLSLLRRASELRPFTADAALLLAMGRYGENAIALERAFPGSVTSIDEDTEGVFHTRLQAAAVKAGRLRAQVMSPLTLGFEDATFDMVIMEGVLSSYPARKALAEALRVLKPGGSIGIADCAWLATPVPTFARDVWESTRRRVPALDEIPALLQDADMTQQILKDESRVLAPFYRQFSGDVRQIAGSAFKDMKHLKSQVKQYKHEIDVYLKLGGDRYMGYFSALAGRQQRD